MNDDDQGQGDVAPQAPYEAAGDRPAADPAAEGAARSDDGEALGAGAEVFDDGAAIAVVEVVVAEEGALRVRGDGAGVRARGRGGERPQIERRGDRVRVELPHGGDVELPHGARLDVGVLPAALSVRGVHGGVDADRVDGDVRLSDVGPATIGAIGGGLAAEGIHGALDAAAVGGSARVAGVEGDARLPAVGGGARIADVAGDLTLTAGGGVRLVLTPRAGSHHRVTAGGSIRWFAPEALDARLQAMAGGRIRLDVPGERRVSGGHGAQIEVVLGEGSATVELSAGGSVRIGAGHGEEWDGLADGEPLTDMAARISVQVEGLAEAISSRINETIGGLPEMLAERGLGADQIESIAERLQHAGERAAERVEVRLRRMSEKAERLGERAERLHGRGGGAWSWSPAPRAPEPPRPPAAPKAPAAAAHGDEVMAILRMVEGGKLSADEAERLIAALGTARS